MKKIMVVDDSGTMRQLVKMVLMRYIDCQITEARDGMEALSMLKEEAFDLVVTDVNMPRMDGLGFVRAAREVLKSTVPIVIVTTKGGEADRDKGLQFGANAYLTKPINGTEVVRTIRRFLG